MLQSLRNAFTLKNAVTAWPLLVTTALMLTPARQEMGLLLPFTGAAMSGLGRGMVTMVEEFDARDRERAAVQARREKLQP